MLNWIPALFLLLAQTPIGAEAASVRAEVLSQLILSHQGYSQPLSQAKVAQAVTLTTEEWAILGFWETKLDSTSTEIPVPTRHGPVEPPRTPSLRDGQRDSLRSRDGPVRFS